MLVRSPYWLRHLRSSRSFENHLAALARDPVKFIKQVTSSDSQNHGIKGIFSDSEVKVNGNKVEVHLDVQNFSPDQIHVKTIGNEILVEGKKEVKRENGWTKSHFERKFLLTDEFSPERVECHLDRGKLKLVAFRSKPTAETSIPIQDKSAEQKMTSRVDRSLDVLLICFLLYFIL